MGVLRESDGSDDANVARAGSLVLEGALNLPETCLKPIARDARSYRLSEKSWKIVRICK